MIEHTEQPPVSLEQPGRVGHSLNDLLSRLDTKNDNECRAPPNAFLPTPPTGSPRFQTGNQLASASNSNLGDFDHPALAEVHDANVDTLIKKVIQDAERDESEEAFFVGDLSGVYSAVQKWRSSPVGDRVELFYAVKCNPSPTVLHLLSLMGTSFDCASVAEIESVLSLPSAPSPDRIIFANPCKPVSFIRAAAKHGVEMMTFDNADELHKIARSHPRAKLVLRILTDDSKSLCRLGLKFGAPLATCHGLIKLARQLGLNIIGVSFHVGSGCKDPMQFADAVWRAKQVFDMGKKEGYTFDFLDVGGGFEAVVFDEMSQVLRDSLELYFPVKEGVRVVAEPGRFLVAPAFTLATNIIARRRALDEPKETQADEVKNEGEGADVMCKYSLVADDDFSKVAGLILVATILTDYINDGVYSAFNCIMFDHQIVHPYPLTLGQSVHAAIPRPTGPPPPNVHLPQDLTITIGYTDTERASVWGPTCDSIDCVREVVHLPRGMEVGDWLGWGEMGAYTMCAASKFNGMPTAPCHWTTGGDSDESKAVRKILDAFLARL